MDHRVVDYHQPAPPSTPKPQWKRPPSNSRGRGKGRRGRGRGQRNRSSNYDQYSSTPRRDNYQDRYYEQYEHYYPQRTPILTYNRYSPLREERPQENYNSYHPYRETDSSYHNRSPFRYNQQQPGPPNSGDFPKEPEGYKRTIDANVGLEGGGVPEKRKRV